MKKRMLLAACVTAVALLMNGCAAEGGTQQDADENEQGSVELDPGGTVNEAGGSSGEEGEENTAAISEGAESQIQPAATRQEALDLYDKAFTGHDFAYLLVACIEPYGQQNVEFLVPSGVMTEDEYWAEYDNSQGSYYDIGVFESYSSEITSETQIEDLKAIEEELLQAYSYSCTVQDAYEVTYNRIATGTEGTAVNGEYCAQMILVDGSWYISKML